MLVYIVEMLRYGDREEHSYVYGVYSDEKMAEYDAMNHISMRANKYYAEIRQKYVDSYKYGRLVKYVTDQMDDDEYDIAVKSRQDWLNYLENKKKEFFNE